MDKVWDSRTERGEDGSKWHKKRAWGRRGRWQKEKKGRRPKEKQRAVKMGSEYLMGRDGNYRSVRLFLSVIQLFSHLVYVLAATIRAVHSYQMESGLKNIKVTALWWRGRAAPGCRLEILKALEGINVSLPCSPKSDSFRSYRISPFYSITFWILHQIHDRGKWAIIQLEIWKSHLALKRFLTLPHQNYSSNMNGAIRKQLVGRRGTDWRSVWMR